MAEEVGTALVDAGITILEVPLRGADLAASLESVRILARAVGDRALVGAGTVLRVDQVAEVVSVGARLVVSPNFNAEVVAATRAANLVSLPGVFSPTEAFQAIDAGAVRTASRAHAVCTRLRTPSLTSTPCAAHRTA